MNEEELTRLAEEELLKEAKRAAVRAEAIGPEGWRKCPSRNVNKRFLVSTIRDAVYTNKRVKIKHKNVYYRDKSNPQNDKIEESKESLEENKYKSTNENHSNDGNDHKSKEKETSERSRVK